MSASQPSPEWLALDKALTELDPKWYAQTPAWIAWHAFMSHDAASAASPQASAAGNSARQDEPNKGGVSAASPQGSATAKALGEPIRFYCNKCGYVGGSQFPHIKPGFEPPRECDYMASVLESKT